MKFDTILIVNSEFKLEEGYLPCKNCGCTEFYVGAFGIAECEDCGIEIELEVE